MELLLKYNTPAPDTDEGWEQQSLPIGSSHLGANVFGGVERERLQITENSLENPGALGGLNSFADIYISFPHEEKNAKDYLRSLDIDNALARVRYSYDGVAVEREYFTSYPDAILSGRISSSAPIDFDISLVIPHLTDEEGREKKGESIACESRITMRGKMSAYAINFAGELRVYTDGEVSSRENTLSLKNSTDTYFIFSPKTNYELDSHIFLESDNKKKLRDFDPYPLVLRILDNAEKYTYNELKSRHISDYRSLFARVSLSLGECEVPSATTDELLHGYANGERSKYLETLYFQYGRYLLISSSRRGCLPANLQGVWNCHDRSPWGSGYWHNINVQMNYWPAFITNIAETFDAYVDFYLAFKPTAEKIASYYVKNTVPENYTDEQGECGWTIGTGNYAYCISGPGGHSGPGTCGLTSKLFWEYYDFTQDRRVLTEIAYPALLSITKFLLKTVRDYDGKYLSVFSASPEQILTGGWHAGKTQYYHTVGCAFDQQMIWENGNDLLRCVDIIGEENLPACDRKVIDELRMQIDRYDPVQVGYSGQIKEYREESFYGEIGEYTHRHISQLVGLHPGTLISAATPAWLDAAKVTLDLRTDESTGWALAHRLNAWARTKNGNRAYRLLSNLLSMRTYDNLWDAHPPFQIDGNFGATAGIAEMLLQSHEGYISPLAALPDEWQNGEFSGLCARGGFEVSVKWENSCAKTIAVKSLAGNKCKLKYANVAKSDFSFDAAVLDNDTVEFETETGKSYTFEAIPAQKKPELPKNLRINADLLLSWEYDGRVDIWRALDSEGEYTLIAEGIAENSYRDTSVTFDEADIFTYKLTPAGVSADKEGVYGTLNHSTALQRQQYIYKIKQTNLTSPHQPKRLELGFFKGQSSLTLDVKEVKV